MPHPRGCPRRAPRLRGGHLGDSARPALSPPHGAMQCWHPVPRAGSGPWPGLLTAAERGQRVGRGGESREEGCPPPRPGCCWPRCPGPGCAAATPDAEMALRATAPGPRRAYGPGSFSSVPFGHRRVFMERLVHLGVWRCTGVAASSGQRRVPADWGPRFQARVRPAAGRRG